MLWKRLRKNKLGVKFRRQHPIGNFIADFYCHRLKLVIEIDGGYHLEKQQNQNDKNREDEMLNYGIKTIRFTNQEIMTDINKVIAIIENIIG